MNLDAQYSELTLKTKAKLVLVVLDGWNVNANAQRFSDVDFAPNTEALVLKGS